MFKSFVIININYANTHRCVNLELFGGHLSIKKIYIIYSEILSWNGFDIFNLFNTYIYLLSKFIKRNCCIKYLNIFISIVKFLKSHTNLFLYVLIFTHLQLYKKFPFAALTSESLDFSWKLSCMIIGVTEQFITSRVSSDTGISSEQTLTLHELYVILYEAGNV